LQAKQMARAHEKPEHKPLPLSIIFPAVSVGAKAPLSLC
jgi:hypothetical protein